MSTAIVWAVVVIQGFTYWTHQPAVHTVIPNIASIEECQAEADIVNAQHIYYEQAFCVQRRARPF
jgi:hypothetical protein